MAKDKWKQGFEMFSELVRSVLSEMSLQNGTTAPTTWQARYPWRILTCQHVPARCETGPSCNLLALITED